ncbi:hypothetical protein IE81DRAFT_3207 [Ceraceosorus guamensis]|uniref:Uncharacterized protein n=1 Tax=Ceraceosorus guamensis TaxID=1522189 RepID=A0A316W8Y6_9BASI|nr:hypothetical protein IE81DRAFT_3207 [Ceraceosorus guamensis]PWN46292.1 hypothetical protein IE81DRAFT_3207 [Ceraceosorus guamensis]
MPIIWRQVFMRRRTETRPWWQIAAESGSRDQISNATPASFGSIGLCSYWQLTAVGFVLLCTRNVVIAFRLARSHDPLSWRPMPREAPEGTNAVGLADGRGSHGCVHLFLPCDTQGLMRESCC